MDLVIVSLQQFQIFGLCLLFFFLESLFFQLECILDSWIVYECMSWIVYIQCIYCRCYKIKKVIDERILNFLFLVYINRVQ